MKYSPNSCERSASFSSRITFKAARATAAPSGFPPNVEVLGLNPGSSLVVALVATEEEEDPIPAASLEKVGVVALVVGVVHVANVWSLNAFRRRALLRAAARPFFEPNDTTVLGDDGFELVR